jgi:predicted Zn-dependent protease
MIRALALLLAALLAPLIAAEAPLTVSPAVAQLLQQVAAETDPAKSEAILLAYGGAPHALVALALGNTRLARAERNPLAEQPALVARAREAFSTARQLDPTLRQASLGLARCAAQVADWKGAVAACAGVIDQTSPSSELAFYIDCAARAGDARLASNLVQQAIIRYPGEAVFRRQELALLVSAERWEEAQSALLSRLANDSDDREAWRTLARVRTRTGDRDEALLALESTLLLAPDDREARRALAEAQAVQGQAPAALATLQPLIADLSSADPKLVEFAARIAVEADRSEQARHWLAALPTEKRSRSGQLLAARLAAMANDPVAAELALQAVLKAGESDAAVLTWAGSLAERSGDLARAEGLYRQAEAQANGGPAALRLVLLLQRLQRHEEARTLLEGYRRQHPGDPQLRLVDRLIEDR